MPFGPSLIGAAAFTAVKLVGYSVAGRKLNKWYRVDSPHPIVFGIVRTCIGLAVGISLLYFLTGIAGQGDQLFFAILIPVRFLEWFLVIFLFFERKQFSFKRITGNSALGIFYSFVLDIPAILSAFVVPGGMWVC